MHSTLSAILPELLALISRAGAAIMAVYRDGDSGVEYKSDGSPVTSADHAANSVIQQGLARLTPSWPVISEEGAVLPGEQRAGAVLLQPAKSIDRLDQKLLDRKLLWKSASAAEPSLPPADAFRNATYWLLDPLDGTREFLEGNGEFAISLALVSPEGPQFGVIFGPALDEWYWGGPGLGVHCRVAGTERRACCRPRPSSPIVLLSRRHRDRKIAQWLERCRANALSPLAVPLGSAIKLGRVAAGSADAYPRFGTTMAWDTAAGQALLAAAGGACLDLQGRPLRWASDWRNGDFIALGDPQSWQWLWQ